ncbi:MAG: hypothetical protein H6636_08620 [Anaerolineales bacterium]|nr:hypothetical protein [Anaerolineales bacterium]
MGEPLPVALSKCLNALNNGDANLRDCKNRYPEFHSLLPGLLDVAVQLTYLPYVSPDERFRKESRARILKHVSQKRAGAGIHAFPALGVFLKAPAIAVLLILVVVVLFGGRQVAYAATTSLPGDTLYGVKTFVEDVQIQLGDDAEDVILHLAFAQVRLDEASQLTTLQRYDDIPTAVKGFEQHTRFAFYSLDVLKHNNPALGEQMSMMVEEKATENLDALSSLVASMPGDVQPSLQQALTVAIELSGSTTANVPASTDHAPAVNINIPAGDSGEQTENPQDPASTSTPTPAANPGNSGNAGNTGNATPSSSSNGNSGNNGNGNDNGNSNGNSSGNTGGNNGNSNGNSGNNGNNGNSGNNGNGNDNNGNDNGNNGNSGNNGNGNDNKNDNGKDK